MILTGHVLKETACFNELIGIGVGCNNGVPRARISLRHFAEHLTGISNTTTFGVEMDEAVGDDEVSAGDAGNGEDTAGLMRGAEGEAEGEKRGVERRRRRGGDGEEMEDIDGFFEALLFAELRDRVRDAVALFEEECWAV